MNDSRYRPPRQLAEAKASSVLYLQLDPKHMAMFRFLLEAYDNVAMFTVLEPKQTLLKLIFSPHDTKYMKEILASMKSKIPFALIDEN
jgi:hypothetical protein